MLEKMKVYGVASLVLAGIILGMGVQDYAMAGPYHTLVVAKTGANYNTITKALNAIGNKATATNPYLIQVMPGTYTESVTLKSHVHVQGSGMDITIIKNSGEVQQVVMGANYARLSQLTVKNTSISTKSFRYAIFNNSASPAIDYVKAEGSGGSYVVGIYNNSSSPALTHCIVSAYTNTPNSNVLGIKNNSSSPTLSHCTVTATTSALNSYALGIYNVSSSPTITNCIVSADTGMSNSSAYGIANESSSSFAISNCTVSASTIASNSNADGVYNYSSSPDISNCTVSANSSSSTAYGIYINSSSPVITDTQAKGNGGSGTGYGLYIYDNASTPTVHRSILESAGTTDAYSVFDASGNSPAKFANCQLIGTYTVGTPAVGLYCYDKNFLEIAF